MVLDSINKFAREGCDATETLQKIQRYAFRLEDRARQAAHFHDNVAGRNLVGITVTNLDISRRIDAPKNFSSCSGAGNDCFFTHNDASSCVQRFWHEEISSDVAVPNVFFKSGGDRIVTVRRHLGRKIANDTREMRLGLSGPLYQTRPRVVLGKSRRSKYLNVLCGVIRYEKRFRQGALV